MTASAETILQFGAGRFLRAFVDRFVQHANDAGQDVGKVVVVQSTPGARADSILGTANGMFPFWSAVALGCRSQIPQVAAMAMPALII